MTKPKPQPNADDIGIATPDDLNRMLLKLADRIDAGIQGYQQATLEAAEASHAYRRRKAEAYLAIAGQAAGKPKQERTIDFISAQVDIICDAERHERDITEAIAKGARENQESLRSQLTAVQSVASTIRAEIQLAGRPNRD